MGLNNVLAYTTFSYTPSGGAPAVSVTIRDPEWGNEDTPEPNQVVRHTLGGQAVVYNRGPVYRRFRFDWHGLRADERATLDTFFGPALANQANQWFKMTRTPTQFEILQSGMQVNGATIKSGQTLAAPKGAAGAGGKVQSGQRILADSYIWIVRVVNPPLNWKEVRDCYFDLTLVLETFPPGGVPSN